MFQLDDLTVTFALRTASASSCNISKLSKLELVKRDSFCIYLYARCLCRQALIPVAEYVYLVNIPSRHYCETCCYGGQFHSNLPPWTQSGADARPPCTVPLRNESNWIGCNVLPSSSTTFTVTNWWNSCLLGRKSRAKSLQAGKGGGEGEGCEKHISMLARRPCVPSQCAEVDHWLYWIDCRTLCSAPKVHTS